jgi:ubiquitin-small subunit ribosomal protein S27Ae
MADKKKEAKEKIKSQKWKMYEISGDSAKAKKSCPKCGPGVFLADHKDRMACGRCGYMVKKEKKPEEKA